MKKELTKEDLTAGHCYSAKKPSKVGLFGYYNDREIVCLSPNTVQYDSPTVKIGRKRPTVPIGKFLSWAKEDITDLMPENGYWRE